MVCFYIIAQQSGFLTCSSSLFLAIDRVAESIVTSVDGPAITHGASGDVITSFSGSLFPVNANETRRGNNDKSIFSAADTAPVLIALVTAVGGTLLGAWLICQGKKRQA